MNSGKEPVGSQFDNGITGVVDGVAASRERDDILRTRARALAQKPTDGNQTADDVELIVFSLSGSRIALESSFVREVLPLKEITPVPCTPSFVLGIINARGQILSVIDIKRFFDLTHQGLSNLNKIIVMQGATAEFGILVDDVLGMTRIPLSQIQPPPAVLTQSYGDYLRGVSADELLILNANRILSDDRLVVNEEVII